MNIIQRLPMDIISRIIPYTYQIQNKELLKDILHYIPIRQGLFIAYLSYWIKYSYLTHQQDLCWLSNDIFGYMNNHEAIGLGYTSKFMDICYRNPFLKTPEDVVRYMFSLEKKNINTQINVCLGLLNPQEREEFKSIALNQHLT